MSVCGSKDTDKMSAMCALEWELGAHNLGTDKWKALRKRMASFESYLPKMCVCVYVCARARCLFDLVYFIMLEKLSPIFYCEIFF